MIRLYLPLFLALFMFILPKDSFGQRGELAGLTQVNIVVALSHTAETSGLTESQLKDRAFNYLKSKIPRLALAESEESFIGISVNLHFISASGGRDRNLYGGVTLQIRRQVALLKTSKVITATVWASSFSLRGPRSAVVSRVGESLDNLLADFAADWHLDNPAK